MLTYRATTFGPARVPHSPGIAISPPTGELWIGGFGFVQIWGTAPVKRRLGWKIGHEEISALESSVEANVMCAAASDGCLLIFNLRTGRYS